MPTAPPDHRGPPGRPAREPAARRSSTSRGYDRVWQRLRRVVLAEQPLCQSPGCRRPSIDVDHIVPMSRGGARLDRRNLQALCRSCHSEKTAREDGRWG